MSEPIEVVEMPEIKDLEGDEPVVNAFLKKPPPCGCITVEVDSKKRTITLLFDKIKVVKLNINTDLS